MRAWLKKHFPAVDKNVDRLGYWAGFFALLWAIMSGIASSISGLSQYGWGAVVFAGLGVACAFVLVVSVFLAAWRYFNPIAPQVESSGSTTLAREDAIQEIRQKIADVNTTMINLARDSDAALSRAIGEIENKITSAHSEQLKHLHRTAFLLSHAFVANFYKQKIQEGLDWWEKHPRTGPFDNDSQIRTEVMRVEKFIDDLRTNIGPSHWGAGLYRVVQEAEYAADHEVMLKKTAPDGLSPFEYRRFHIACTQYERIGAFLKRAIEEANSFDKQNLQMIRDRTEIHQ